MSDIWHTDVLVAGARPAGATIARLLALRGKRVTMVDPAVRRVDRLEVLSPSAIPVLNALDLGWVVDDQDIARRCLGIRRRWGTAEIEMDDFLCHRGGVGYVVNRSAFDARLRGAATKFGADILLGQITEAWNDGHAIVARADSSQGAFFVRASLASVSMPPAGFRHWPDA